MDANKWSKGPQNLAIQAHHNFNENCPIDKKKNYISV